MATNVTKPDHPTPGSIKTHADFKAYADSVGAYIQAVQEDWKTNQQPKIDAAVARAKAKKLTADQTKALATAVAPHKATADAAQAALKTKLRIK